MGVTFYLRILLAVGILLYSPIMAFPMIDIDGPEIRHTQPVALPVAGTPLTVDVTVTDDVAVVAVTLFYRIRGQNDYLQINMGMKEGSLYQATLSETALTLSGIEYYFSASDPSGNVSSIKPFFLAVRPKPVEVLIPLPEIQPVIEARFPLDMPEIVPIKEHVITPAPIIRKPWYKKWWVWGIGGAILAGVAAANQGQDTAPAAAPAPDVE